MNWIHFLLSFYIVWSLICSTGTNIGLSTPLDVTITNRFLKQRGKAISIKWVFSGLSGVFGLPMVAYIKPPKPPKTALADNQNKRL